MTGRLLNGSQWPAILRTDAVATTGVSRRVVVLSTLTTFGFVYLAAVSVVTPLGLSEGLLRGGSKMTEFIHVPDLSPIGQGTNSRANYGAYRLCGFGKFINCPGQDKG